MANLSSFWLPSTLEKMANLKARIHSSALLPEFYGKGKDGYISFSSGLSPNRKDNSSVDGAGLFSVMNTDNMSILGRRLIMDLWLLIFIMVDSEYL